jgi:hypothetical protein
VDSEARPHPGRQSQLPSCKAAHDCGAVSEGRSGRREVVLAATGILQVDARRMRAALDQCGERAGARAWNRDGRHRRSMACEPIGQDCTRGIASCYQHYRLDLARAAVGRDLGLPAAGMLDDPRRRRQGESGGRIGHRDDLAADARQCDAPRGAIRRYTIVAGPGCANAIALARSRAAEQFFDRVAQFARQCDRDCYARLISAGLYRAERLARDPGAAREFKLGSNREPRARGAIVLRAMP